MVHGFVHHPVLCAEPIFANAERSEDFTVYAGFFGDFAYRGLFCFFTDFDVTLRHSPACAAATVDGSYKCNDLNVTVEAIDDQPASGVFPHRAQASGWTAAGPTPARSWSWSIATRLSHSTT
jgi:hypothetical protein